jgi:TPR repeat protein
MEYLTNLKKRADEGDPESQFMYGLCHQHGYNGAPVNLRIFYEYVQKSANQSFAPAMYNLVCCLQYGWGTDKNTEKALAVVEKMSDMLSANQQQMVDLKTQVIEDQIELKKACVAVNNHKKQMCEKQSELKEADTKMDDLNSQITKKQDELKEANTKMDDLNLQIIKKQDELKEATTKIDELSSELKEAKAKIDELKTELVDNYVSVDSKSV